MDQISTTSEASGSDTVKSDLINVPFLDQLQTIAAADPQRIAIRDQDQHCTYRQLVDTIQHLAHTIVDAAVPDGPIGILLDDTHIYIAAMLSVIAAGRPALPLDRGAPSAVIAQLIRTARIAAIIVIRPDETLPANLRQLALDDLRSATPRGVSLPIVSIHDPALLISTSGSTGIPKITAHSQHGLLRRIINEISPPNVGYGEPAMVLGAPQTLGAIRARLVVLLCGGTLSIIDLPRDGLGTLLHRIEHDRCRLLRATPSLMRSVVRLDGAARALAHLRHVRLGGEPLLQTDLRAIRAVLPGSCQIHHSMAATETSVARWIIPEIDDHDPVRVAAGHILPGLHVQILDEHGHDVTPGESGELVVGLSLSALGDWIDGRLDRTRFQQAGGLQLYRTGDIARLCPDGVLVVHGRSDRMVKINGNRVEPGAVEAVLSDLPWVREAAIVATGEPGSMTLHAFVVTDTNAPGEPIKALRSRLRAELPACMRPSRLHLIDALPLLRTGKRDSRALAALAQQTPSPGEAASVDEAAGDLTALVLDIWRRVLPQGALPGTACFDEVGGDSLRFVELILRLERRLGHKLPMERFSLEMTVSDMAQAITRVQTPPLDAAPGPRDIVFLLPGAGGDEPGMAWLRAACASDLRFVQLAYGDWTTFQAADFNFDTLFASLLDTVLTQAPSGPIRLAGYSIGGQIGWLLAARLEQMGREVSALLMLDSPSPLSTINVHGVAEHTHRRLSLRDEWQQLREARHIGRSRVMLARIVARRLLAPRGADLLRLLARHHRLLPMLAAAYLGNDLTSSLLARHFRAWRRRQTDLPVLQARTVLIRARANPHPDWDLGWQPLCANLEIRLVDGDHTTMLSADRTGDVSGHMLQAFARPSMVGC